MAVAEFFKLQETIFERNCSICKDYVKVEEWNEAMHCLWEHVQKRTPKPEKATTKKKKKEEVKEAEGEDEPWKP